MRAISQSTRVLSCCHWLICGIVLLSSFLAQANAQEPEWIGSPEYTKDTVPENTECYYRRVFTLNNAEAVKVTIAADDTYELYFNGQQIGTGEDTKQLFEYDLSEQAVRGSNVIAVKVENLKGATSALCASLLVKESGGSWVSYSTDPTWKTNANVLPAWNKVNYNDRGWESAQSFGRLGKTAPWDVPAPKSNTFVEKDEKSDINNGQQFTVDSEFEVHKVADNNVTGSAIAMAFNEFGQIVLSREQGPLMLLYDDNNDQIIDKSRVYCNKVSSCQGILCFNGEVFVTGNGPAGAGLYRLTDKDQDGMLETVKTLFKFEGENGEHGAHGISIGPDGLLYIVVGNLTKPAVELDPESPYRHPYEGDLAQPRYEDPGGHAVGVKAPGGMVIRTDTEGSAVQIVAGGLRNAYDLAFNRDGELFIPDSDMESDENSPWYRPTRVYHIIPGGEYGWRSGWSNWPDYYVDQVPPLINNGRGSPTGIAVYNHFMFPQRYHGALFMADWSAGQIVAFKMKRQGASYKAESTVFLQGNPLNVTDLEVGPDGNLYFITGGRGTEGGLYRVSWSGKVPQSISNLGEGITAIIRQPQLQSPFARQNISLQRKQLGASWDKNLIGVASSSKNPPEYRLQAIDLLQLYGPAPTEEFLLFLSKDPNERVRAKAAELMGLHATETTRKRLIALLADADHGVRRKACEALANAGQTAPFEALEPALSSDDRFTAFAARRLLERLPAESYAQKLDSQMNIRVLVQSSLALSIAHANKEQSFEILQLLADSLDQKLNDRDFLDVLRAIQVTLHRSEIQPDEVEGLRTLLQEEFPAGDPILNRELIRLLVHLQVKEIIPRALEYMASDAPELDRAHVATHLRYLKDGWNSEQRLELLKFYEDAQHNMKAGSAFTRYMINITRDFCTNLTEEESLLVLEEGASYPNAALGALFRLPPQLNDELREKLIAMDKELSNTEEAAQRLKIGILAVLSRSGDEASQVYLRQVWEQDPERRQAVAMGLSMHENEANWPYLVGSLSLLDNNAAPFILERLTKIDQAPEEAEPYRQVILLGLKLKEKGAAQAVAVLQHWTGESLNEGKEWSEQLPAWQDWYSETFPDALAAQLPESSIQSKWKFDDLLEIIGKNSPTPGDSTQGAKIFVKAQCAKCHRCGSQGKSYGPDLTTVSRRFSRKEILESIYYPSHVISSQYAAKNILMVDGKQYSGIVTPGLPGEIVVVTSEGTKIELQEADIEETTPSKTSNMPIGLLDTLSKEEIVNLMSYLLKPTTVTAKRSTGLPLK